MLIKHAATAVTALLLAPLQRALPSSGPQPPVDPPSITPEWATAILRQQGLLTAEQRVGFMTDFARAERGVLLCAAAKFFSVRNQVSTI